MDTLQYVKNLHEDGSVDMFLYGHIGITEGRAGQLEGIDGQVFADELSSLNNNPGVTEIRVHINSPGGLVHDGLSIIGAIGASKIPVDTYIDGIAASIAGVISQAGRKRFMNDFGRLMIHAPKIPRESGGMSLNDRQKMAIAQIQGIIAKIFDNNTKRTKEEMVMIMEKESWFNAESALSNGLIDEIISTERMKITFGDEEELDQIENNVLLVYNKLAPELDKQFTPTKQTLTMETVVNHLKLQTGANETQVLSAIQAVENKAETLETSNTDLTGQVTEKDARISELEEENKALKEAAKTTGDVAATEYVENCIKEGKFDVKQKDALVAQAQNDLVGFKAIAEAATGKPAHADITNELTGPSAGKVNANGREDWTLRDWEKKDAKGLKAIQNDSPDTYAAMYKTEYGTDLIAG